MVVRNIRMNYTEEQPSCGNNVTDNNETRYIALNDVFM